MGNRVELLFQNISDKASVCVLRELMIDILPQNAVFIIKHRCKSTAVRRRTKGQVLECVTTQAGIFSLLTLPRDGEAGFALGGVNSEEIDSLSAKDM